MQTTLRLTARVLAGSRIEITAPELREGDAVDVFVVLPDTQAADSSPEPPSRLSALELLDSLPPGPRALPTWEQLERSLQEERAAWDR